MYAPRQRSALLTQTLIIQQKLRTYLVGEVNPLENWPPTHSLSPPPRQVRSSIEAHPHENTHSARATWRARRYFSSRTFSSDDTPSWARTTTSCSSQNSREHLWTRVIEGGSQSLPTTTVQGLICSESKFEGNFNL